MALNLEAMLSLAVTKNMAMALSHSLLPPFSEFIRKSSHGSAVLNPV